MKWDDKYTKFLWIAIIIAVMLYVYKGEKKYNDAIDKHLHTTICKTYKFISKRSFTNVYYYYYKGMRYQGWGNLDNTWSTSDEDYINRYYEVEISSKEPSKSRYYQDREVRDIEKIKAAGFKNVVLRKPLLAGTH